MCGTVGPVMKWRKGETKTIWEEWMNIIMAECMNGGYVLMRIAHEVAKQIIERKDPELFIDINCRADHIFWKI